MKPPLLSDILSQDPSSVIRYSGFGACPKCGHNVDEFFHGKNDKVQYVVARHHGRQCTLRIEKCE